MERSAFIQKHPCLFHMAEDGAWDNIRENGLLSTRALVDRYQPDDETRRSILEVKRADMVRLERPGLPTAWVRDQKPLKFLDRLLLPGVTEGDYLDALNGRVFFWLTLERLRTLAKAYRKAPRIVLTIDTEAMLAKYGGVAELAPYNTGALQQVNLPKRGPDVFKPIADYPYDEWKAKRGARGDAAVELTVPGEVIDIADFTVDVTRWRDVEPAETIYRR